LFALLIAVTFRDIVMGVLATVLALGSHTPQLWLGRSRPPVALTGGPFGVEASLLMLVVGVALATGLLYRADRRNRIVPPAWNRAVAPDVALTTPAAK
jgi:hypothetical protein